MRFIHTHTNILVARDIAVALWRDFIKARESRRLIYERMFFLFFGLILRYSAIFSIYLVAFFSLFLDFLKVFLSYKRVSWIIK